MCYSAIMAREHLQNVTLAKYTFMLCVLLNITTHYAKKMDIRTLATKYL